VVDAAALPAAAIVLLLLKGTMMNDVQSYQVEVRVIQHTHEAFFVFFQ
jgi:hypothetical protein